MKIVKVRSLPNCDVCEGEDANYQARMYGWLGNVCGVCLETDHHVICEFRVVTSTQDHTHSVKGIILTEPEETTLEGEFDVQCPECDEVHTQELGAEWLYCDCGVRVEFANPQVF